MELERYKLMSRIALHQPQIDMEACIRAIRAEISQAVKLAFKEMSDKQMTHPSSAFSKDKAVSQQSAVSSHKMTGQLKLLFAGSENIYCNIQHPPLVWFREIVLGIVG